MTRSLVLITMLGLARLAHADPDRDPDRALEISIAATVGSLAIGGAGIALYHTSSVAGASLVVGGIASLVVTPAFGHIYGEHRLFTGSTILRAAGLVAVGVGAVSVYEELFCLASCSSGLFVGAGLGVVAIAAGTALDLASARSATTRWNREHHVELVPVAIVTPSRVTVPGLGIEARF